MEIHIVVRNNRFSIGEPSVQRVLVPGELCPLQSIRVLETGNAAGFSTVDVFEPRAFLVCIQGVTSAAPLLKEFLAAYGIPYICCIHCNSSRSGHCRQGNNENSKASQCNRHGGPCAPGSGARAIGMFHGLCVLESTKD